MIIRKLGRNTREYGVLGSSNEELNRLMVSEDLEEGFVIRTDFQSEGKGYHGNTWSSEKGKNLLFSILLKPDFLSAEKAFHLSRIVSLSIVDVLDNQGIRAEIKWPNDIMVASSKICGILIENGITGRRFIHSVIGIGLNVNQEKFNNDIPSATSMIMIKGCHFDRERLLEEIRMSLESWYQVLIAGNEEAIMEAYLNRLYLHNASAWYSDGVNEFRARIRDVLQGGELELEIRSGDIRRFGFKEIEYLGI